MAKSRVTDRDMGLSSIRQELAKLGGMHVEVGIPENKKNKKHLEGATIAQYAYYNEYGVEKGPHTPRIPARPFMRGWFDSNRSKIEQLMTELVGKVEDGKDTADDALGILGVYAQTGIQTNIAKGDFEPNSEVTINGTPGKKGHRFIEGKGRGKKPLTDTAAMKLSISYVPKKNGSGSSH